MNPLDVYCVKLVLKVEFIELSNKVWIPLCLEFWRLSSKMNKGRFRKTLTSRSVGIGTIGRECLVSAHGHVTAITSHVNQSLIAIEVMARSAREGVGRLCTLIEVRAC
jgi:hypothetical protein